jgi:hypothetical protein
MPWTTPRTWATSDVVTAAMMNTNVRDNENWLHAHHGCSVYKSANQTVANGNNDVVTWNSELYDTDAMHDPATNNSRVIVPTGLDGYWSLACKIDSDADATNNTAMILRLRKNAAGNNAGGTLLQTYWGAGATVRWSSILTWVGPLVAADYLEVFVNASSEAHDIQGGAATDSYIQAAYLGA